MATDRSNATADLPFTADEAIIFALDEIEDDYERRDFLTAYRDGDWPTAIEMLGGAIPGKPKAEADKWK